MGRNPITAIFLDGLRSIPRPMAPRNCRSPKPMIALQLVREALADGVAPAPVLGDAAYGDNAEFRAGLRTLGLEFFLQVDAAKHKG